MTPQSDIRQDRIPGIPTQFVLYENAEVPTKMEEEESDLQEDKPSFNPNHKYSAETHRQDLSNVSSSLMTDTEQDKIKEVAIFLSYENQQPTTKTTADEGNKNKQEQKISPRHHSIDWSSTGTPTDSFVRTLIDIEQDKSRTSKSVPAYKKRTVGRPSLDLSSYKPSLSSILSDMEQEETSEPSTSSDYQEPLTKRDKGQVQTTNPLKEQASSVESDTPLNQTINISASMVDEPVLTKLPTTGATSDEVNREESDQQEGGTDSGTAPYPSEAPESRKASDPTRDQTSSAVIKAHQQEDIFESMIASALKELEMEASDSEEQKRRSSTGDRCRKSILFPEVVVTDRKQGTLGFKMHKYVLEQDKKVVTKHPKAKARSTKEASQARTTCRYIRKAEPSVERLDSERILNTLNNAVNSTAPKQDIQRSDDVEEVVPQDTPSQQPSKKTP
ncbi:biorientation of chromosomes in cell division protein 1-like 1 [Heterodontus francisci]|uniref:biorientation of chromosomes in cell division protein 1-like 1 n=1 Tax=Heterodontus francisci TaxID=7792 RepID=UPI00355B6FC9